LKVTNLRISHPEIGERVVELKSEGLVVGREGVDLEMPWDPRISRRHARFWMEEGSVWIEDFDSKNGTWLGQQRLHGKQKIFTGVSLIVGETMFTVELDPLEEMMASYVSGDVAVPPELRTQTGSFAPVIVAESPQAVAEPIERKIEKSIEKPVERAEPKKEPLRTHPRFVAEKKVGVRIDERSELKTLWTENISKGGLFVRTEAPPPRGTVLEVVVTTPGGELALKGEVVHVLDSATAAQVGHPAGVGLAFVDLRPDQKKAISDYVDGLNDKLEDTAHPGSVKLEDRTMLDNTMARARDLIAHAEKNDLYRALALDPQTSANDIAARVQSLKTQFANATTIASPPQIARINAALKLVERTAALMASPGRRLEYDFRIGQVRAEQRIEQARNKTGPTLAELRTSWAKAFPDRIERSMALAKAAFELRKSKDLVGAMKTGRQALDLDPFHEELRQNVRAWTSMMK
jgi:uncharacterized protein (TIGR02266 family)